MNYTELRWPKVVKVTGRSSTIRGQFIKAIVPHIPATEQEYLESLRILGQDPDNLTCSYCGIPATEWDHFRPVVGRKQPTGFITDIYNLVPACGKCNQSKSGAQWDTWITGRAKHAPKPSLHQDQRIKRLRYYEAWSSNRTYRLSAALLNSRAIQEYMEHCEELIKSFSVYEEMASLIRTGIERSLSGQNP